MGTNFSVKFDMDQIERLGASMQSFDPESVSRAALEGVNTVVPKVYDDAREKMLARINLTDGYLQQKMTVRLATNPVSPVASIVAKGDPSNLISYQPKQLSTVVRFTNSMIKPGTWGPNPRKPGASLKWRRRIGNTTLGIPVDRKQAGVAVEVTRGAPKPMQHSFVITSKRGFTFVASREKGDHHGKGKVHAKTGPSVYQLFRAALDERFLEGVQDQVSAAVVERAEGAVMKAFP